jgi:predicted permease
MVVDAVGRALLRGIVLLLPPASRREYGGEILELSRLRRGEVQGVRAVTRLWLRELAAALAAVWTAWADGPGPRGRRTYGPVRRGLDAISQDVRFAVREIRRGRTIPALVVVTLAIGIGAVLTVFSMVDGLLLHPIPVPEPERVVRPFQALNPDSPFGQTSYPMLADYRRSTSMEGPAGWMTLEAGFRADGLSDRVSVGMASGDFFEVLRVIPQVGRLLQPADDLPGAPLVVVLSDALWARVFNRDPAVIGSTVEISGTPFTVIGVTPRAFRGASLEAAPDLWAPLTQIRTVASSGLYAMEMVLDTRAFAWISMVGRLHDGAQAAEAEAELDGIAHAVRAELEEDGGMPDTERIVRLRPLAEAAVAGDREETLRFVALLGAIVSLTLLIACLNAALLISTRAWSRDLDLSVRQALGAARGRLLRHLLAENLLLALAGAGAGIGLALLAGRALRSFALPGGTALARLDMALDARLAGAAVTLALISAAAFGLGPALAQSRRDVGERLRAAGRGVIRDVAGLPVMIALQAGLSLVLLVGALLFGRTLMAALDTPLGFEPDGVAAISFAFQGHGYAGDQIPAALDAIVAAVEASPAVSSAAVASHVPLSLPWGSLRPIPENAPEDHQASAIAINTVSGGYFRSLGIPLVAGRTFEASDTRDAPDVAVVNRAAAALLFPDRPAIGERFVLVRGLDPVEVVGIVADHKVHSVADEGVPYIFLPAAQNVGVGISTGTHLLARAVGEASVALAVLRDHLREFDPSLPAYDARQIGSQMNLVLMPQRFGALLLGLLAGVTLLVSAIGVYAMVSFGVRRRTREIGIRMALGAAPRRVMFESLAGTGYAVLAGVVTGILLAAGLVRFVEVYLYGVDPLDVGSFGLAAVLFVTVSLLAAFHPALRAARIGPDRAIRQDR